MTRLPSNGERIKEWDDPWSRTERGTEYQPRTKRETEYQPAGTNGSVLQPPTGFDWQQESHRILEVCNRWRVHARWWEGNQAVWREYFKVTTDSGLLCLIYHDLQSGDWYLSRIYD